MRGVPKRSNQKLKLLYLYKILLEQTDAQNGLTLAQISGELLKYGITAERKTLYDDIEALKLFGVDIATRRDRSVRYFVASREFSPESLKLIADLLDSSSLLPPKDKEQTLRKLARLGGKSSAALLGAGKEADLSAASSDMTQISLVCRAILENRALRCRCFEYNSQKQRIMRFDGAVLTLSPWYVELAPTPRFIAYDHSASVMRVLAADRLVNAQLLGVVREGESEYLELCESGRLDGMLGRAQPTMIRLSCSNSIADEVIRRFGLGATILSNGEESFEISVKLAPDDAFYFWLFKMRGKASILSPESVLDEYKKLFNK